MLCVHAAGNAAGLLMYLSSGAVEDIQPARGTLPLNSGAAKQSAPAAPKESLPEITKQTAPAAIAPAPSITTQSHSNADKQEVLLISILVKSIWCAYVVQWQESPQPPAAKAAGATVAGQAQIPVHPCT